MKTEQVKIEPLKGSDRAEFLDVLTRSFNDQPLAPSLGAKHKATRAVMGAFIEFFAPMKGSMVYGIRLDGKLVCAVLAIDSASEPSSLPLMRFIFSMAVAMGWEAGQAMEAARKEAPEEPGRYLELIVIGLLPEYRRRGLGKQMLDFLREEALRKGFDGMIAIAARDSGGFSLYRSAGFVAEKEITTAGTPQCWMRLRFDAKSQHTK